MNLINETDSGNCEEVFNYDYTKVYALGQHYKIVQKQVAQMLKKIGADQKILSYTVDHNNLQVDDTIIQRSYVEIKLYFLPVSPGPVSTEFTRRNGIILVQYLKISWSK